MAKKIPTFTSDTVSSACSDISKIVEAKSLNQKRLDHETSLEGALLIGRRLEQETAGYPITNLKGLLSPRRRPSTQALWPPPRTILSRTLH